MDQHPTLTLPKRQKECLRLVGQGYTDKEIAIELEVSPNTVRNHVVAAMKTLGVTDRRVAAKMLSQAEGAAGIQHTSAPQSVATDAELVPTLSMSAALVDERADDPLSVGGLREEHPAFSHEPTPGWRKPPFPTRGRPENDLRWWQVVGWTLALTAILAIATGVIANGAVTATKIIIELTR